MRNSTSHVLQAIALAAILAASAVNQATAGHGTITEIVPPEVGADQLFEVLGSGLALPGLEATLLHPLRNRDGRVVDFDRTPLSVVAIADDRVALRVRAARPGQAFVLLTGAHGAQTITTTEPLFVHAPHLGSGVLMTAAPGGTVVLPGAWLGGRGTLSIGGVRARVETWAQDAITVVLPAQLPEGIHGVEVRNRVGRALVAGVVESHGEAAGTSARCVVREQGATRSYIVRSATYDEAAGALDVYASRMGPIQRHQAPTRRWVPGYTELYWDLPSMSFRTRVHPGHWEAGPVRTWTTQSVRDVRLTATGATFDASGRAVTLACSLDEGAHTLHPGGVAGAGHDRGPPTELVVVLRRAPDGSLSGSFSGLRRGRLVEGSFQAQP
jgi:hypothetical protein